MQTHPPIKTSRQTQRGVSLLFALVALIAMMLGALAMVRHTDTGTQLLGNLGFKQDATASADQVTRIAVSWLSLNSSSLNADVAESGYYASNHEFDADGVTAKGPIDITGRQYIGKDTRQLIDWDKDKCKSSAESSYATCSIKPGPNDVVINDKTARYVILRMCNKVGDYQTDSSIKCAKPLTSGSNNASGRGELNYSEPVRYTANSETYFRVLVRVQGARNTTSVTETIVHF